MAEIPSSSQPQFTTAEYKTAGPDHCAFCNQSVGSQYYRVGNKMACITCGGKFKMEAPEEGGSAFSKAMIWGCGAALLGLILYSTVVIVTGYSFGYAALGVGFLIGKAIKKGSSGF